MDSASWSPLWNYTLLSESGASRVITMDTYAGAGTKWGGRLTNAIDQIGLEKLGAGLETIDPNTGHALPLDVV